MIKPLQTAILILLVLPALGVAREQSVQEVPISVSAISGEELSLSGIADTADLLNTVNALPFSGRSSGQNVFIRGVAPDMATSGRPGYLIDGIQAVEVLRGPQGALFGRASIPGVIDLDSGGRRTETFTPESIDAIDVSHYRYSNFDDNFGLNYTDDSYVPQEIDDSLVQYYGGLHSKWKEDFSKVSWGDVYGQFDFDKGPNLGGIVNYYSTEENKPVAEKAGSYPNDPLYPKKGSKGKASGTRKAIGSLLSLFGSSVEVSKDEASAQWGLPETGFYRQGSEKSAWDVAAGDQKNVVVAVIDSGLDMTHVDRPQHVWTNGREIAGNGIDDDNNGYIDDIHGWNFYSETNDITDDNGHGTFVAGIIAAKTNNGEGIAGINPGAVIMPLKVLNREGKSRILSVYRAIRYAVDNGARVLNLSLGGKGVTRLEQIGINYAYAMGCIVVVAAGNEGDDISQHGPPGARRAFSVGAVRMDGKTRPSSNRGYNVAVTAPGHSIYSLAAKKGNRDGKFMPIATGKYFRASGTSFSAPFVTGAASLIWSKYPSLNHRMVEDMIMQSAKDIHDSGWDPHTGYGLLDGYAALTQDPRQLLAPRITEVFVNKHKRRIASVDLYGVIRGNLDHYTVSVGRGKKPKKWQTIGGRLTDPVDYQLISRLDGAYFAKGSHWIVKVDAVDKNQRTTSVNILISKDKG